MTRRPRPAVAPRLVQLDGRHRQIKTITLRRSGGRRRETLDFLRAAAWVLSGSIVRRSATACAAARLRSRDQAGYGEDFNVLMHAFIVSPLPRGPVGGTGRRLRTAMPRQGQPFSGRERRFLVTKDAIAGFAMASRAINEPCLSAASRTGAAFSIRGGRHE